LSLFLLLSHDNFTLHEPEKAKGEVDSQIEDLLHLSFYECQMVWLVDK
jgi:hypothetical protein